MTDLVSRIESRIREIKDLLGERDVPKGTSGKNTSRVAFDMGTDGEKLGFGSLPALGGLKVIGMGEPNVPIAPFKPDTLRPLGQDLPSTGDPKQDGISALLNAEANIGADKTNDIRGLLPLAPLTHRSNTRLDALRLQSSRIGAQGPQQFDGTRALERALEAYKAGPGSAKPRTEDPLPR
jgi:hypothetical protein